MKMEAETGGSQLSAKEGQGLLATRSEDEAKKDPSPEPAEEAWPCQHLELEILDIRT